MNLVLSGPTFTGLLLIDQIDQPRALHQLVSRTRPSGMHGGGGALGGSSKHTTYHLDVLRDVYTTLGGTSNMAVERAPQERSMPQKSTAVGGDGATGTDQSGRGRRDRQKASAAVNSSSASVSSGGSMSPPSSRKRRRRTAVVKNESLEESDLDDDWEDDDLARLRLPDEHEQQFVMAVFNIGLKNSSPKVLMDLMPAPELLTTEHIKSHLQKYRLHHQRSKEEFMEYYEDHLKTRFVDFCESHGWARRKASSDGSDDYNVFEQGRGPPGLAFGPYRAFSPRDHDHTAQLPSVDPPLSPDERTHHLKSVQDLSSKLLQEQLSLQSSIQTFIQTNIALQGDMIRKLNSLAMDDPTTLLLELSSAPVGFLRPSVAGPISPAPPPPAPLAPVLMAADMCEPFSGGMQGHYASSQKQPHYPQLQAQHEYPADPPQDTGHFHPYRESGGQASQHPQSPASLPLHTPTDYQHQHHFDDPSGDYMEPGPASEVIGGHSSGVGALRDD